MIRRSSPPRRRSPLARSTTPIKKKKRTPKAFARIYGGEDRVTWVSSLPCVGCGRGPCQGHHVENGGTGRKASADRICALCASCHRELHDHGRATFEARYGVDLRAAAVMTEAKWIAHSVKNSVANDVSKR